MADITLRVVDGADRGRSFDGLRTPVTIGREEGNSIQLNDDRVSRFHVKIQEDNERVVLTDLESTNGTKVNGEDIQLRILRFGDMISVGRSTLIFGTREQILDRLRELRPQSGERVVGERSGDARDSSSLDLEVSWSEVGDSGVPWLEEPPELPERLSPSQAAQVCELLMYLHRRIRNLVSTVRPAASGGRVTLDFEQWQELVDTQARLAEAMRSIGDPDR
ncbi:MAG: FHA domain-containing protein [Planctomycetes bacterium]|nr:FHA domain-containing protein [Planctomycetota bacterium]